jgi:RHS repeat-associated protein
MQRALRGFLPRLMLLALLAVAVGAQAAEGGGAVPPCARDGTCAPCGPNPGGNPSCGASGPASQGNTSGTNVGAGNPINLITGNKYQQEVDMPALPGELGLEVVRHYNSAHSRPDGPNGLFGKGWRLSYETELLAIGNTLQIVQADGTRATFARDPKTPSLCASMHPADGYVQIHDSAAGPSTNPNSPQASSYTWHWTHGPAAGRSLRFDARGKLIQITAPSGAFVSLTYAPDGQLAKVTDPQGRSLTLHTPSSTQVRADQFRGVHGIDTPLGRFVYRYGSAPPAGTDARDVRAVLANLVQVSRYAPGAGAGGSALGTPLTQRHYYYEDARHPTLLTGISVQDSSNAANNTGNNASTSDPSTSDPATKGTRLSTYGYDRNGRANLSVRGEPARLEADASGKPLEPKRLAQGTGLEQVTLTWPKPGQTVLTNSLGQDTVYTHGIIANQWRLLEARGPGCASCGPTNVRYAYNAQGQMTAQTSLTAQGQPIQATLTDYDQHGRVVSVWSQRYSSSASNSSNSSGKLLPQAKVLLQRFEYADANATQPSLIAAPSVIAGKEHTIRISYNAKGQPIQVTESGWAPDVLALQAGGKDIPAPATQPVAITRSTVYSYSVINGKSLLTQVDGPLANGKNSDPSDSDITRYTYDDRGDAIIGITYPMGLSAKLTYTEHGQLKTVTGPSGITDAYTYTAAGQLAQVLPSLGGQRTSPGQAFAYDAQGNVTQTFSVALDGTQTPTTKTGYDALGRLAWQADALGILKTAQYDTESRLRASTVQNNWQLQQERYTYHASGQLASVADSTGALRQLPDLQALRARRTVPANEQANARTNHAPTNSLPRAAQDNAGNGGNTTASASPRQWQDDFGRILASDTPNTGLTLKRYNAANQLIGMTDAQNSRAQYDYDAAGRIVKQTVIPAPADTAVAATTSTAPATAPLITQWKYQGTRLAQLIHPTQTEHYTYSPTGWRTSRTVQRPGSTAGTGTTGTADNTHTPATTAITATTAYTHNPSGQLTGVSLPDGSRLHYQRNGQGQVVALTRSSITTPWLQGLAPAQPLATDIQRDLVGPRSITAGNGIQTQYQRSKEGVLARLVHAPAGSSPAAPGKRNSAEQALPKLGSALDWLITAAHAGKLEGATAVTTAAATSTTTAATTTAATTTAATTTAATTTAAAAATNLLPGALSLPRSTSALSDERYLWDSTSNLLLAQGQHQQRSYAYDSASRLIAAVQAPRAAAGAGATTTAATAATLATTAIPTTELWRYAYDSQDRRLLAQEGVADQSDIASSTVQVRYAGGTHRQEQDKAQSAASMRLPSQNAMEKRIKPAPSASAASTANPASTIYTATGQPLQMGSQRYQWDALGRLASVTVEGSHDAQTQTQQTQQTQATYTYDHRGLRIGKVVLQEPSPARGRGQGEGRSEAAHAASSAAGYLYNEQRQLIAELNAQGRITRQYVWLADLPVAVIDTPQGKALNTENNSASSANLLTDLKTLALHWTQRLTGRAVETITYLHSNHLGAPIAATDAQGQVLWQAGYAPFGAAKISTTVRAEPVQARPVAVRAEPVEALSNKPATAQSAPQFVLNLRLPGQYFDAETALHYNDQRYYHPQQGRYLTPDPLGTPDGPNPYAYVANNPLKYIDPLGLILFAFDGTNNSNPPPGVDDFSNVYKFYLAYDQEKNGRAWYMNGIGRDDPESGIRADRLDQYNANSGRARVDYMLRQLDEYVKNTTIKQGERISIDIVGFSRGAATARDFSNRVATWMRDKRWANKTNCVEIRFMGLWDTVAQFGANGAGNGLWQLAIPAEAKNVFHAVALNEHRELFPGESAGRGVQRGFIGSHADIGGSYGTGDLSDVALNWIVDQARASGIAMKSWDDIGRSEWGIVTNPVLHDKSTIKGRGIREERDFCLRANNEIWANNCQKQRQAAVGGLNWAGTLPFITNYAQTRLDADGESKIVGEVKMKEYAEWLKKNYGLTIQYR